MTSGFLLHAQGTSPAVWHNKERILHYKPSDKDFILHKGNKKFNRALYGTNTGFRVEAGDLPEFALYLPGMGGNCKLGLIHRGKSKWITEAKGLKTIYRPGAMIYEIRDELLQSGFLRITALAMGDAEGMILKIETHNTPGELSLVIAYGAASGKKFSRDGDIGADPESSFYMQANYCKDNIYRIEQNRFQLMFGFSKPLSEEDRYEIQFRNKQLDTISKVKPKILFGVFPTLAKVKITEASSQENPISLLNSQSKTKTPVITGLIQPGKNSIHYFYVENNPNQRRDQQASEIFKTAEKARKQIAERILLETPDEFINPLAGALSIAADGIWESPTYLHGAVAWRMRLPAWRGAYVADALGWQDRARLHFDSYLKSQVTDISPGSVEPDTLRHFARQTEKMGNAMFSNGYICRSPDGKIQPHHYDMNLVFIDQLLTHLKYTGDIDYIKKVWPAIQRHLQWEKRNFDADGDGLYDAYACIWASDALQYSGGGVTHSSAYNFRANKMAAQIAQLLGEDGNTYDTEANRILKAMNLQLWLKDLGTFAEYKDFSGLQLLHGAPGLWTIYHAIDEETATLFQKYQMLRYIDRHIPQIPVQAKDLSLKNLSLLATTNWQPYTWSINNVALAENLHTSLAYWQSGEAENAFQLWRSALVESMYLGSSPGNFQQLSFYDAVRGELYRDFADPIGIAARTLTEGLFGIVPDALHETLHIQPGFPEHWKFARLKTPNISFDFRKDANQITYHIHQKYPKQMKLLLRFRLDQDMVNAVMVNGKKADYHWVSDAFHQPIIEINAGISEDYVVQIQLTGNTIEKVESEIRIVQGEAKFIHFGQAKILSISDPDNQFSLKQTSPSCLEVVSNSVGIVPLFIQLRQGQAEWTVPVQINTIAPVGIEQLQNKEGQFESFELVNHSGTIRQGKIMVNRFTKSIAIPPKEKIQISVPLEYIKKGHNQIIIEWKDESISNQLFSNWDIQADAKYEPVNLEPFFNDHVTNTFKHLYLSPRPASTSLQIPWQGIGNWCYPLIQPDISVEGIKNKKAVHLDKIPFLLGSDKNIGYTSQWKNFPETLTVPLSGKADHAYLLMAGTTNHQQSQMANGIIYFQYTDGSKDSLPLKNPDNWWPIEQDYMQDGFAFKSGEKPYRLIFKTGEITRTFSNYTEIKGFSNRVIAGGAATVLDIPLNKDKTLQSMTLKTLTNEVVLGIMSLSLER